MKNRTDHIHIIGGFLLGIAMVIIYVRGLMIPTDNVKITTEAKVHFSSNWKDADTGESIDADYITIAPTECIKIKQKLPDNIGDGEILGFFDKGFHVMAYVNGFEIYESGEDTYNEIGKEVGAIWKIISLDDSMSGEYILIAFENNTDANLDINLNRVYIGSQSDIVAAIVKSSGTAFAVFLICMAMCLILGFIAYNMKKIGNKEYFLRLHPLIQLTFLVGIWVFTDSSLMQVRMENASVRYYLTYISFMLIPIALNKFYIRTVKEDKFVLRIMSAIYKYAIALCLFLYTFNIIRISNATFLVHAYLLAEVFVIGKASIHDYRTEKNGVSWSNILTFCIMTGFLIVGMYLYFYSKKNVVSGFIGVGYLLFLAVICVTQVRDLTSHYKELIRKENYNSIARLDPVTGGNSKVVAVEWLEKEENFADDDSPWMVEMSFQDFTTVNVAFGWEHGNEILRRIYETNQRLLKDGEMEFSYGNATIAFFLKGDRNIDDFCKKVSISYHKFINEEWQGLNLPERFAATKIQKGESFGNLLDHLTMAYVNKLATYNESSKCHYYNDACREQIKREFSLQNRIGMGIVNGEFETHLMPYADPNTGKPVSANCMLLWNHPDYGCLQPADYVPVAIHCGEIQVIALYQFRQICQYLAQRKEAGLPDIKIYMMLAADHLKIKNFFKEYIQIMKDTGVPRNLLVFSVWEDLTFDYYDQIKEVIDQIHAEGATICLDRFGLGKVNVEAIRDLKFDEIVLEAKFIGNQIGDAEDNKLLKGVIELFHGLGMKVSCKGICTEEQCKTLAQCGLDAEWGYHYNAPISIKEFKE